MQRSSWLQILEQGIQNVFTNNHKSEVNMTRFRAQYLLYTPKWKKRFVTALLKL